ncbi:hypothetical protein MMC26_000992 [Xylographa opegraphella]|nr:hypothetical protein [Xylographa opegraphella]
MLDLALLSPSDSISAPADLVSPALVSSNISGSVLALSRRPAILTYTSPIVDTASKLSSLPWYMLGWRKESEVLEINMFEGVVFSKGWRNIPDKVRLTVEADEKMQFYEVSFRIVARFGGLRWASSTAYPHTRWISTDRRFSWILYNHRILSYLFFTTTFFTVSLTSTCLAYLFLSSYLSSVSPPITKSESGIHIKREPSASESEPFNPLSTSDLSDASRTFPTIGRQMPLHFSSRTNTRKREEDDARVKQEEADELERTTRVQPLVAEPDDEDEDDDAEFFSFRDSGIGTSLDEGDRRAVQRRRKALFGGGGRGT